MFGWLVKVLKPRLTKEQLQVKLRYIREIRTIKKRRDDWLAEGDTENSAKMAELLQEAVATYNKEFGENLKLS